MPTEYLTDHWTDGGKYPPDGWQETKIVSTMSTVTRIEKTWRDEIKKWEEKHTVVKEGA